MLERRMEIRGAELEAVNKVNLKRRRAVAAFSTSYMGFKS